MEIDIVEAGWRLWKLMLWKMGCGNRYCGRWMEIMGAGCRSIGRG